MNSQLIGSTLDEHFLEGPQLDLRELEQPARSVVERPNLDTIIEDTYASAAAYPRDMRRRRDPSGAERGRARYSLQQLEQREPTPGEEVIARPVISSRGIDGEWKLRARQRRLD